VAGQNDTSPSSEESEDESIVAISPPALSPEPPDIHARSRSVRQSIWQAYRSIAQIYDPCDSSYWPFRREQSEPWGELGEALEELRIYGVDANSLSFDVEPVLSE
jgi:hypothetical protein